MTFLTYAQLPNVTKQWNAYTRRCRKNRASRDRDVKRAFAERAAKALSEQALDLRLRAAYARWDEADAASWTRYSREWDEALRRKKESTTS